MSHDQLLCRAARSGRSRPRPERLSISLTPIAMQVGVGEIWRRACPIASIIAVCKSKSCSAYAITAIKRDVRPSKKKVCSKWRNGQLQCGGKSPALSALIRKVNGAAVTTKATCCGARKRPGPVQTALRDVSVGWDRRIYDYGTRTRRKPH